MASSKSRRRPSLTLLCVGFLLSACPPPSDCFLGGGGFGGFPVTAVPLFGVEGQRFSQSFQQPLGKCDLDPSSVTVRVEVISPDNQVVTAEVEPVPYDSRTGTSSVNVSFVPSKAGSWQIITTFEPGLGRSQDELFVAHAHRDAGRLSVSLPTCEVQPFRTTNGLVLCAAGGVVTTRRTTGDAGVVSFEGKQLAVFGNAVWSSHDNTLTRRTDTGTELRVDGQMMLLENPRDIGFTNERTAIRGSGFGSYYERFDFIDGGLVQTGLPISTDDQVFTTSDGGLWHFNSGVMCQIGRSIDGGCRDIPQQVLAFDDDGLWLSNGRGPDGEMTPSHLPSPLLLASQRSMAQVPGYLIRPSEYPRALVAREQLSYSNIPHVGSLLLRVTKGELHFDWYPEIANQAILGTRGDYVVTRSLTGQVTFVEKEY